MPGAILLFDENGNCIGQLQGANGAGLFALKDITNSGTTAERDTALGSPPTGRVKWDNTTKGYPEYYDPSDPTGGPNADGWKQDFVWVSDMQKKLIQCGSASAGSTPGSGFRLQTKDARLFMKLSSTYTSGSVTVNESIDGIDWNAITGLSALVASTYKDIITPIRFTQIVPSSLAMSHAGNGLASHVSTGIIDTLTGLTEITLNITSHGLAVGDYIGIVGASGFFVIKTVPGANQVIILVPSDQVAAVEAAALYTHPAALLLAYI